MPEVLPRQRGRLDDTFSRPTDPKDEQSLGLSAIIPSDGNKKSSHGKSLFNTSKDSIGVSALGTSKSSGTLSNLGVSKNRSKSLEDLSKSKSKSSGRKTNKGLDSSKSSFGLSILGASKANSSSKPSKA